MVKSFQKKYAVYYDILYQDKNYEEEIDFLEEIFDKYLKKRPKKILDLACGTGSHLLPLAKRGYQVSGLDLSGGMLELAKIKAKKENLKINLYHSSMQKFSLGKKFEVIISMFSAINYLIEYNDLKSFLKNVRDHLDQNGLFVFDFWNGLAVIDHFDPYREKEIGFSGGKIKRISRTTVDEVTQLCSVNYECQLTIVGKNIQIFKEKHILKFYFIDEIKNYLEDAGFSVLKILPFLELGGKVGKSQWDLTVICEKKHE